MGVLILPFLVLISQHLAVESLIWLTASIVALVWDIRQIRKGMRPMDEDVLYIDESETLSERFTTRNYDFRYRG